MSRALPASRAAPIPTQDLKEGEGRRFPRRALNPETLRFRFSTRVPFPLERGVSSIPETRSQGREESGSAFRLVPSPSSPRLARTRGTQRPNPLPFHRSGSASPGRVGPEPRKRRAPAGGGGEERSTRDSPPRLKIQAPRWGGSRPPGARLPRLVPKARHPPPEPEPSRRPAGAVPSWAAS